MLGLPGEREEDLEGIADLACKTLLTARNRGQVTVSLSTFVPKPHTPFQWQRQIDIAETDARQAFFRRRLKNRNISIKWHDAGMSLIEGILSRGDEKTGALIETAFRLGCRFDGWSDYFRFDQWEEAMLRTGVNPESYLRERPFTEAFPWERIESGVSREFLLSEANRAEKGEPTPDCRSGACGACGVCGQAIVRPVIVPADASVGSLVSANAPGDDKPGPEKTLRIRFAKLGPARFLSHLELASALSRAVSLAGISFVYSKGYHPHPKISFAGATSVGMESRGEFADIRIQDTHEELDSLADRISAALPAGMRIVAMVELPPRTFSLAELVVGFTYNLILPDDTTEATLDRFEAEILAFLQAESFCVRREAKGTPVMKEIRPFVTDLALDRAGRRILLSVRFGPEGTVRATEVLTGVLSLSPDALRRIGIVKTGTELADFAGIADRQIFSGDSYKNG
jgi:radical SAM-linked protein